MPRTLIAPRVRRTSRLAAAALSLSLAAPVLVASATAHAGTVQFRDPNDVFSVDARERLRRSSADVPFDVRVLVTSEASGTPLARQALAALSSEQQLVVAIDPVARRTSVRAGRGLHIPADRLRSLADAGDPYFRAGNYAGGVEAIVAQAAGSVGAMPTRSRSSVPLGLVVLGGMVGLTVLALALARRRAGAAFAPAGYEQGAYRNPAGPYAPSAQGYGYGPYGAGAPGAYGPGGYGAGYAPGHSTGAVVGAGLAGAALGGVAGYAIANAMHDDHGDAHRRAPAPDTGYDGGGDDSSWGSGGDDGGWE